MKSIRIRLLAWTTGAILVATLLVSLITYQIAWDGFNQVRDFTLEQIALSIERHGIEPDNARSAPHGTGQFISQIWATDGTLQFSSTPEIDLPLLAAGHHNVYWQDHNWHVFTLKSTDAILQVANTEESRELMFDKISQWLLLPLVALIILLSGLLSMAIKEALGPLGTVRRQITAQDISKLHELPASTYPAEIIPMVDALNSLLSRIDQMLTTQRRFVADAAHELRTPLTAIKLQTQIALASPDENERRTALDILQSSVDRAAHLIDQLLELARLDHDMTRTPGRVPVNLGDLARERIIAFLSLAEACHVDLGLGRCDDPLISGNPESLRILIGNLIDNALRYAGNGSRVDVEIHASAEDVSLWVIDDGPGIPDADKAAVFERFRRLASAEIPGSGLGLAIVKEIVELHHGSIELRDTPGGGLSIRIGLPREASADT